MNLLMPDAPRLAGHSLEVAIEPDMSVCDMRQRLAAVVRRSTGTSGWLTENIVLVASELVSNVLRHGGGFGRLRCTDEGAWLSVKVSDSGPGMPAGGSIGAKPSAAAVDGRGLWLCRQLCDRLSIVNDTSGVAVTAMFARLVSPTPASPAPEDLQMASTTPTGPDLREPDYARSCLPPDGAAVIPSACGHSPRASLQPAMGLDGFQKLLDQRAIEAVFQPIVDLATGQVVGFEGLARGPAGTPWHDPSALIHAAAVTGRLAELDWVCRAAALSAAMGRLAPGISLFVNIESATGLVPCPPDLRGIVAEAEQRLSLVAEVTERLEGADWATVTAQVSALRSSGYRIAVDDLGAHWTSLAVLDLLQPDVIKLDLTVSRGTNPKAARIAQAARRHADSTGAIIVAEGLETSDHLGLARRRGARLGQGFLFGVPAPLADVAVTPCRPRLLRT